jgi:hypothetical protein
MAQGSATYRAASARLRNAARWLLIQWRQSTESEFLHHLRSYLLYLCNCIPYMMSYAYSHDAGIGVIRHSLLITYPIEHAVSERHETVASRPNKGDANDQEAARR